MIQTQLGLGLISLHAHIHSLSLSLSPSPPFPHHLPTPFVWKENLRQIALVILEMAESEMPLSLRVPALASGAPRPEAGE